MTATTYGDHVLVTVKGERRSAVVVDPYTSTGKARVLLDEPIHYGPIGDEDIVPHRDYFCLRSDVELISVISPAR
jgi:hypothetical protein